MRYTSNRVNDFGIWFVIIGGLIAGIVGFYRASDTLEYLFPSFLVIGSVYLVFEVLLKSVQKVLVNSNGIELHYFFTKKNIPFSRIKNIEICDYHVGRVVMRNVEEITLYLEDNKIVMGGFGGFMKSNTKKLFNEISDGISNIDKNE